MLTFNRQNLVSTVARCSRNTSMKSLSRVQPTKGAMNYLIHHVFLPPQLPQEDDYSAEHDTALLRAVMDALEDFKHHVPEEQIKHAECVISMLSITDRVRDKTSIDGSIDPQFFKNTLKNLSKSSKFFILLQISFVLIITS